MFAFLCVRGSEERVRDSLIHFCISIFNTANIKTFATFYSVNFIIIISFVNASSHSNEYEIDVNRMLCGRFVVSFKLDPFHCNPVADATACLLFYSKGAMKKSILYMSRGILACAPKSTYFCTPWYVCILNELKLVRLLATQWTYHVNVSFCIFFSFKF